MTPASRPSSRLAAISYSVTLREVVERSPSSFSVASVLAAKTTASVRVVGNVGVGILADPTNGNRQNDVLTFGASFARAVTRKR